MLRFITCFIFASVLFLGSAVLADGPSKNDQVRIHVLTVAPGEELFARFGHIAMMVEEPAAGRKTVYNYGTFNFSDPKLRIRYARGFLNYWLSTASFNGFLSFYAQMNRGVTLQTLNLTPSEALDIKAALEENAKPENRTYLYRHYLDNCCTRIRDMIDNHTGKVISRKYKQVLSNRTYRDWTARALVGMPIYKLVILYSLGPAIDHPLSRWDEQFLPEVLSTDLDNVVRRDGRPLILSKTELLHHQGPPVGSAFPFLDVMVLSIIGGLLLLPLLFFFFLNSKKTALSARLLGPSVFTWGLVAGLGGLMLALYWAVTTHYDTHYNENLLLNPPTHLWLAALGIRLIWKGRLTARTIRIATFYLLGSLLLVAIDLLAKMGLFIQHNYGVAVVAIVMNTVLLLAFSRLGKTATAS